MERRKRTDKERDVLNIFARGEGWFIFKNGKSFCLSEIFGVERLCKTRKLAHEAAWGRVQFITEFTQ